MKYRQLGASGLVVSEIGFGAWGIGGATPGATSYGPTDDHVSLQALRHALERGELLRALAEAIDGLLRESAQAPDLAAQVEADLRALVD